MIIIYRAANSLDANMIKSLLAQYDIPAFIQGELLQGGAGELPATDLVTVSVADTHHAEAKKMIQEWESGTTIEAPETNLVDGVPNVAS